MNQKKVPAKASVVISLTLVLGFFILQASSAYSARATVTVRPSPQTAGQIADDQLVIARVSVSAKTRQALLELPGLRLLGEANNQVFIQTTYAELQRLTEAGWSPTLLYIRDAGEEGTWKAALGAFADCTGTLVPNHKSYPATGGFSSFTFETNSDCEWTLLTDAPWIHLSGAPQGTGGTTVTYSVDANPTTSRRVGHIFIGDSVYTVYEGRDYVDVPIDNPFYVEIGKLSARGITSGCDSDHFCPNKPLTREEMAAFIIRSIGEFNPPPPVAQRFTDVPPSNQFYSFIDRLAALGITSGCTPTEYCPTEPVLRQQIAAFILRALGEPNPPTPDTQRFVDVPPSNPFYKYIDRLAVLGITQGCSGNPPAYCPMAPVVRSQAAVFLTRAFDL